MIRNKKTVFRAEKKEKVIKPMTKELAKVITISLQPDSPALQTPQGRIYQGLDSMATKFFERKEHSRTPIVENIKGAMEEAVVDMIKEWRLRDESGKEKVEDEQVFTFTAPSSLKKDNVPVEDVVKIINDHREKIYYERYQQKLLSKDDLAEVKEKLTQIEGIFEATSNVMEWEAINIASLEEVKKDAGEVGDTKEWLLQTNNFLRLGRNIINRAEQSKILQEYTTLNEIFTKRLKDGEKDIGTNKVTGDKRSKAAASPLSPPEVKKFFFQEDGKVGHFDFTQDERGIRRRVAPLQKKKSKKADVDEEEERE